jgi:hypothetical protein
MSQHPINTIQPAFDVCREVCFDHTVEDLEAPAKYAQSHHADGRRKVSARWEAYFYGLLCMAYVFGVVFVYFKSPAQTKAVSEQSSREILPLILLCVVIPGTIALMFFSRRYRLRKLNDRVSDPRLRNLRFALTPGGYTFKSDVQTVESLWSNVQRAVLTPTHLLLLTNARQEFVVTEVVPFRAFTDAAQINCLLQELRQSYSGEIYDER